MKKIKENRWIFLLFILVYICIFLLSNHSFYAPDEFNYSNIPWTTQRVNGLGDIIHSQKMLYENHTGRMIPHTFIYLFLYVGSSLFDILNGFVFLIFIFLIGRVTKNQNTSLGIVTTLYIATRLIRMFGEKYIWLSGSLNYLWMATMMIILMKEMYRYVVKGETLGKWEKVLVLLIAFCVGLSQENVAFTTGMFFILLGLVNIKKIFSKDKKEILYTIGVIITFGIGALILILAPGNFVRLDHTNTQSLYLQNFIATLKYAAPLVLAWMLITIIMLFQKENRKIVKQQLLYFIIPAGIAILPMVLIRDFAPRSLFPLETCFFIAITESVFYLEKYLPNLLKKAVTIILAIITVVPLMQLSFNYVKYVKPYKEKVELELQIAQIHNQKEVVVSRFEDKAQINPKYDMVYPYPDLLDTHTINIYMGNYYHIPSIWATTDENAIIVVELSNDEENLDGFYLREKQTGNVLATRNVTDTKKNRVVFEISQEVLDNCELVAPSQEKIQNISLKTIAEIKDMTLDIVVEP